jgi:hypothetical protein
VKIYLMAAYHRHLAMQEIARAITASNHVITSRWIRGENAILDTDVGTGTLGDVEAQWARNDMHDLREAACCIGFSEPGSTASRGGRHVELGMAIALGKSIVIIGGHEHIFHALPSIIHLPHVTALYAWLAKETHYAGL